MRLGNPKFSPFCEGRSGEYLPVCRELGNPVIVETIVTYFVPKF